MLLLKKNHPKHPKTPKKNYPDWIIIFDKFLGYLNSDSHTLFNLTGLLIFNTLNSYFIIIQCLL